MSFHIECRLPGAKMSAQVAKSGTIVDAANSVSNSRSVEEEATVRTLGVCWLDLFCRELISIIQISCR